MYRYITTTSPTVGRTSKDISTIILPTWTHSGMRQWHMVVEALRSRGSKLGNGIKQELAFGKYLLS